MTPTRSQRWRERREAYVPSASVIAPADYAVDGIACLRQAKPFVEAHHYSGSFPAARLSAGLFRGRELVGVCTFSVPVNDAAVKRHTGLDDALAAVDLGRFVLLDDVPGNGETWFLARALRLLRQEKPGVLAVISYADPLPRRGPGGTLIKPGHIGLIYQGMSAHYRGRATPRTERLTPDGQLFSERAASKLRRQEQGWRYAMQDLQRRGAPAPAAGESPAQWYERLRRDGFLSRRRHPGAHVYAFPLTQAARIAAKPLPRRAYPQAGGDVDA